MRKFIAVLLFSLVCNVAGCGGSDKAIIPTTELTEEQKAAIKAEDDAVADEESQGSNNKKK